LIENDDVKLTKQWIERFVIGLRLCPFAHFSFYNDSIYYNVSQNKKHQSCLEDLMNLISIMEAKDEDTLSNAFLIFDQSLSFDFMLSLKKKLDSKLDRSEFEGLFQSIVFHPEFQFADEDFHASGNFTNRSPLPMMHILREEEIANAISMTENVDDIPFRNKELLENLKIKKISEVFENYFMDKIKQYI